MRIYDVSVPVCARTPVYPGDPQVSITEFLALERGDAANVSLLCFGAHTGTHVDAPSHFIAGARRVADLELGALTGRALVAAIPPEDDEITERHVDEIIHGAAAGPAGRILFKTRNSRFWAESPGEFRSDYTYVTPAAARALVSHGVRLAGIDYLSVERFGSAGFETHKILLGNGVVVVEGLDLSSVPPGEYEFVCLPLRVAGELGDGAPARAILRTLE